MTTPREQERRHYHFLGVAGAGMSALARVLASRGARVTGSDSAASAALDALALELGEPLAATQSAANLRHLAPDLVVASAAIKPENPELAEARRRSLPVAGRADVLGQVMDLYPARVAVSGTHGKTTTSAMIAQMLTVAGLDPTALIGADVPAWGSNTRVGASGIVVAEACEAFGSFLELRPTHAVVTNIEADHLDYYADLDAIVDAFRRFAAAATEKVIVCAEGGAAALLAKAAGRKLVSYGIDAAADITARDLALDDDGAQRFAVWRGGELLGECRTFAPGGHNALNALAAVATGLSLGVPLAAVAAGLEQFHGTARRFELLGETPGGVTVIDDYAHHPTELRATLAAARARYGAERRIVALFQPHLPSRTRDLMDEFAHAFADADLVLVTDIYVAREAALPGVTAERLAERIQEVKGVAADVRYAGDLAGATRALAAAARPGDVALTLGAGSVRAAGEALAGQFAATKANTAR